MTTPHLSLPSASPSSRACFRRTPGAASPGPTSATTPSSPQVPTNHPPVHTLHDSKADRQLALASTPQSSRRPTCLPRPLPPCRHHWPATARTPARPAAVAHIMPLPASHPSPRTLSPSPRVSTWSTASPPTDKQAGRAPRDRPRYKHIAVRCTQPIFTYPYRAVCLSHACQSSDRENRAPGGPSPRATTTASKQLGIASPPPPPPPPSSKPPPLTSLSR